MRVVKTGLSYICCFALSFLSDAIYRPGALVLAQIPTESEGKYNLASSRVGKAASDALLKG